MVIVNSTRTIASIKRINEVFKTRPTIVEKKNPEKLTNNFSVKFDHVSFKYKKDAKQYILKDINFEIKSGQTLGIIGGTGCGKTTVASLLSRFYDPDKGRILIGNVDIKNVASDNLNDNVSAILQDSFLFAGTIESNLKFAKQNATKEDMIEATKNACAFEFIDKLPEKFNSTVEQRGRNFSGGQKQRLSISRTLIKKPKILILDDTTSALDLITEATVQENLRKNYSGTTTVIISQRVSAVKNADLILILDNGKIVANGKHAQLVKTNKLYRDIVSSQLGSRGMEG
jgi:ATP-binding cassette subfamily B protein